MIKEQWLEETYRAYCSGLSREHQTKGLTAEEQFIEVFRAFLKDALPPDRLAALRVVLKQSQGGLLTARSGDLERSGQMFQKAWQGVAGLAPNSAEALLGNALVDAAHAYLDFRNRDWPSARQRVFRVMDADLALETRFGYHLLHLHRVQAVVNLMRIAIGAGKARTASWLAGSIIGYLSGYRNDLPVHHDWDLKRTSAYAVFPKAMIGLATEELARGVVGGSIAFCEAPFYKGLKRPQAFPSKPIADHPNIWPAVTTLRTADNKAPYFARLADFLAEGPNERPMAWTLCVLDFLTFCRDNPNAKTTELGSIITEQIQTWPFLNHHQKETLTPTLASLSSI